MYAGSVLAPNPKLILKESLHVHICIDNPQQYLLHVRQVHLATLAGARYRRVAGLADGIQMPRIDRSLSRREHLTLSCLL